VSAKELIVKVIPRKMGDEFIKIHHYSGTVVVYSYVSFGVFWKGKLHGVLQFGGSIDKRSLVKLVEGTTWNGFIELNRMALDKYLPRNSESRAIAVCMRLLKKEAPHIKWVVSYADGTQCGDGTIYRASGFVLTKITKNQAIMLWKGKKIAKMTLDAHATMLSPTGEPYSSYIVKNEGATYLPGNQLRYIYFIDKSYRKRLTVDEIPFDVIKQKKASMYKGEFTQAVT